MRQPKFAVGQDVIVNKSYILCLPGQERQDIEQYERGTITKIYPDSLAYRVEGDEIGRERVDEIKITAA